MSVSDADNQRSSESRRDTAAETYLSFLDALNGCDLDRAQETVDAERWREVCVGYTSGVIEWPQSRASMESVWKGIPDLRFEAEHLISDGRHVVAVGTVRGKQSGRLFGAPATRRSYSANMFDYVRVDDGKIVDRIQQVDMFGQFRQLFWPLLLVTLIVASAVLIGGGIVIGALVS